MINEKYYLVSKIKVSDLLIEIVRFRYESLYFGMEICGLLYWWFDVWYFWLIVLVD